VPGIGKLRRYHPATALPPLSSPDPFGAPEAELGGSEKGEKSLWRFAKAVFDV
jgi:hypothetical protein